MNHSLDRIVNGSSLLEGDHHMTSLQCISSHFLKTIPSSNCIDTSKDWVHRFQLKYQCKKKDPRAGEIKAPRHSTLDRCGDKVNISLGLYLNRTIHHHDEAGSFQVLYFHLIDR